jgi:hypothetical protein
MFLSELTPIVQELVQQPVAFLGGFTSGLLRLNLNTDPVKGWLDSQLGQLAGGYSSSHNGQPQSPKTISID